MGDEKRIATWWAVSLWLGDHGLHRTRRLWRRAVNAWTNRRWARASGEGGK